MLLKKFASSSPPASNTRISCKEAMLSHRATACERTPRISARTSSALECRPFFSPGYSTFRKVSSYSPRWSATESMKRLRDVAALLRMVSSSGSWIKLSEL